MFESMEKFAKRTGLSYAAIRRFAIQGVLPFVQVGNRRMICVEAALDALEKNAGMRVKRRD